MIPFYQDPLFWLIEAVFVALVLAYMVFGKDDHEL